MCPVDENPYDTVRQERNQEPIVYDNIINQPMNTSVANLEADAYYAKGFDKTPIFNVEKEDFDNNMTSNRQLLRFKEGSKVQQFHSQTRNNPFFIRYETGDGKQFIRKIK